MYISVSLRAFSIPYLSIHTLTIHLRIQPSTHHSSNTIHVSAFIIQTSIIIHSSIHLSIHRSVCPSVRPSVHPSIHPSIRLSINPSFYMYSTFIHKEFIHSSLNHSFIYLTPSILHKESPNKI